MRRFFRRRRAGCQRLLVGVKGFDLLKSGLLLFFRGGQLAS
jgi:hypothetical protein